MNNYTIELNGKQLDTNIEEPLSLNYQISDILNINKRETSFSKTITLPGTENNNKEFKQIFDVNISNLSFNPAKNATPAVIKVGDNEVLKGNLQLINVTKNNKSVFYEVVIVGNFKSIVDELRDYELKAIDLTEFDHQRSVSAITDSWDYKIYSNGSLLELGEPGYGYVYPYIVNGEENFIYKNDYVYNFNPAVYVKTLLDKIFEFAGFTYTSDFFETDYFKKLILPYVGEKIQKTEEELNQIKSVIGSTGNWDLSPNLPRGASFANNQTNYQIIGLSREDGEVDDGGSVLTFRDDLDQFSNSKWTALETGYYNIDYVGQAFLQMSRTDGGNIEFNQGLIQYSYMLLLQKNNGSNVALDLSFANDIVPSSGVHVSPWIDTDNPLPFLLNAEDVFIEAGESIVVYFQLIHGQTQWVTPTLNDKMEVLLHQRQSFDGSFTKFQVVPSKIDAMQATSEINMSQTLPKMKMKDFFYDIIKMFNLVVMDNPNKANDLLIEPRDYFFNSRQKVVDWNDKADQAMDIKIYPMSELDAREYLYTFADDKDMYNEMYTESFNEVYGEYSIDVQNDFSSKTNKSSISFASTPNGIIGTNGRVSPYFAEYNSIKNELTPFKTKPRILFYGGTIDIDEFYILENHNDDSTITGTTITAENLGRYAYCGMYDHPFTPENTLEFGPSRTQYWNAERVPLSNLFNKFHRNTLKSIIDNSSKLLKGKFKLTPRELANFDFRTIIFYDGSYWRVNKIKDYSPVGTDTLTDVELIKVIDIDVLSSGSISAPVANQTCPGDIIVVIEQGGSTFKSSSGQIVTQDCCNSLGGVYSNGVCYSLLNATPVPGPGFNPPSPPTGGFTPYPQPSPSKFTKKNGNSNNGMGVDVSGTNNYVAPGSRGGLILGDNNSIPTPSKGIVVIGDNITVQPGDDSIYLGKIVIDSDGNIYPNSSVDVVMDPGEDLVFPVDKTNLIDVIDGTDDAVRNPGGDSKLRPIIDSNKNN